MTEYQRKARPKHYAQWGADFGFKVARTAPREDALRVARASVATFKRENLASGASQDGGDLFEKCFEIALKEGLLAAKIGVAPRPIRVMTDDGELVIEAQPWVPQNK